MKLSANGEAFIKQKEGRRLIAYECSAGVWTISVGSTIGLDGLPVKKGDRITNEQADKLFERDIAKFELAVNRLVQVSLTQNQFDALVSFTFNLGAGALQKSTLLKKLNAEDYNGAAKEFKRWNRAGGKVVAGLTIRRKEEAELFAKPSTSSQMFFAPAPGGMSNVMLPDSNNTPIPYKTLPLPTAHQEYGEPIPPSNVKQNAAVAVSGVAGAGSIATVIADPQIIAPALSFLQAADWRIAGGVIAVGLIVFLIWILKERR